MLQNPSDADGRGFYDPGDRGLAALEAYLHNMRSPGRQARSTAFRIGDAAPLEWIPA